MPAEEALFDEMAAVSIADQMIIEQTDTGSFDAFEGGYPVPPMPGQTLPELADVVPAKPEPERTDA